jgi:hypothetical protein
VLGGSLLHDSTSTIEGRSAREWATDAFAALADGRT